MGFRFWRRIRLLPGVTVNVGKSGASLSVGPRGAKITVGPHGVRQTVGLPGTGLFYTTVHLHPWGIRGSASAPAVPRPVNPSSTSSNPPKELSELAELPALADVPGRADRPASVGTLMIVGAIAGIIALAMGSTATILFVIAAIAAGIGYVRSTKVQATNALATGYAALKHGQLENAKGALLRCLALAPETTRARYLLALAYASDSDFGEALVQLETIPEPDPQFAPLRAWVLGALGRYDEALRVLDSLPPQTRTLITFQTFKARILIAAGKPDIALEVLLDGPTRKQIKGDPQLLELHYVLGSAYEALGKKREARREYTRVIADSSDYMDAQERYDALAPDVMRPSE